jgi:hypothetical protein
MSVVTEAIDVMAQAEKEIKRLRKLLIRARQWIPTEDQCCDDNRLEIRQLHADIFEATKEQS